MTENAQPQKPLKVAIVGTATTSRMMAPFDDQDWQIWACSGGNVGVLPRVNIWFELHALIEMMSAESKPVSEAFYNWLKEQSDAGKFTVMMQDAGTELGGVRNHWVPKAVPFPRDEMVTTFGRNWFTSSVAYMMALAIARGAKEIALFGVDMAATQEHYEAQKAGLIRFKEIAEANGIVVSAPYESSLLAITPMYGYWEGSPFGRRLNALMVECDKALAAATAAESAAHDQRMYYSGTKEQLRYMQRTWTDGNDVEVDLGKIEAIAADVKAKAAAAKPDPGVAGEAMHREVYAVGETAPVMDVALLKPVLPNGKLETM